ncbi:MAG: pyridoxamine 5'-phosphate oxidase family protein [Clostridia bacterium]|nr:pyridoxamine 5'-phosphate oxidase family protein [Clostridia bacterium]
MFRDLLRKKQKLSQEECIALLKSEKRGVLSLNGDDGFPYGIPMNHFYNEADGCIYFHCGKHGHKTDAIRSSDKASFCVFNSGLKSDNNWFLTVHSVVVFGTIEISDDPVLIKEITRKLSLKFTSDEEYINHEIEAYAKNTLLLKMTPLNICGKTVNES